MEVMLQSAEGPKDTAGQPGAAARQIAVFFSPLGAVMPLHDHPGMTVFSV
jgi:hypothetical protein